eukprot:5380684-Pleurochrysis_carterae.AAC.1
MGRLRAHAGSREEGRCQVEDGLWTRGWRLHSKREGRFAQTCEGAASTRTHASRHARSLVRRCA